MHAHILLISVTVNLRCTGKNKTTSNVYPGLSFNLPIFACLPPMLDLPKVSLGLPKWDFYALPNVQPAPS